MVQSFFFWHSSDLYQRMFAAMPRIPKVQRLIVWLVRLTSPSWRLADAIRVAELGQLAAGRPFCTLTLPVAGMAQPEQRDQEDGDGRQVDDLADESGLRVHFATSRVFRMRYAATNTGSRKPSARNADCQRRSLPPARLEGMLNP